MFKKYDTDHSGTIDLDEFKVLLKDLAIDIPEAKALGYFRKCDASKRGFLRVLHT